jgi:hypothetical protein
LLCGIKYDFSCETVLVFLLFSLVLRQTQRVTHLWARQRDVGELRHHQRHGEAHRDRRRVCKLPPPV